MRTGLLLTLLLGLGMSGCSTIGQTPTPLPTVVLSNPSSSTPVLAEVTASGHVVPAAEAQLAFSLAGVVRAVHVEAGDRVEAGDLLAELESTAYELELQAASRALRELTSPAALAAASQAVATTQQAADTAAKRVVGLSYPRATEAFIRNLEGQIELTRERVKDTSDDYRKIAWKAEDDPERAAALVAMSQAQIDLNQLIANLNWYTGKPSEVDISLTQANLDAANAALQEARWYLTALLGEELPPEATGAKLSALEQAQDAVAAAETTLKATRLLAPIAGTVIRAELVAGEYVAPGEVAFVISDVDRLRVETSDLSERDVPSVQVGQPANVYVEALNQELAGRVSAISPVADTLGGDVVYTTTIELEQQPAGLLAGMTVEVRFLPTP